MRVVRRPDGRWLVDVRGVLPSGKAYRKKITANVTSRSGAIAFGERHWQLVLRGETDGAEDRGPVFEKFAEDWIRDYAKANGHKPSGIAHKELMLRTHLARFNGKRLAEITTADVDKLKGELLQKGKKPKTINNALVVLSRLLRTAQRWGKVKDVAQVDLLKVEKKPMQFYDFERYDRLVKGAAKVGDLCLAVVLLAGDAGLRRGEVLALEWGDIDLARGMITVQRAQVYGNVGTTKGNASRHVPMTALLRDTLERLPRYARERVIGTLSPRALRTLVERAEEAAELPVTGRLHVLRHTFASHSAMLGESLFRLGAVLGHKDHATTQGYAHLAPSSLGSLAALIDKRRA